MKSMPTEAAGIDTLTTIKNVAQAVSRARVLLISASLQNLNYCEAELAAAIESLKDLQQRQRTDNAAELDELRSATRQIQADVLDLGALISQARDFYAGWAALSEANLAGYTASGAPAPLDRDHTRIALKG